MATVNQVFNQNLSTDFNLGTDIPSKITLNLDNTSLVRNPDGTLSAVTLTARLLIGASTITNTGAPLNRLSGITTDYDDIGLTVATDSIDLGTGTYEVKYVINMFDNNSARVAHRSILNVDATPYSTVQGNNYMRDATAHDNAHIDHEDLVKGGVLTMDLQTHSSTGNTTNIIDGYILIKKLA